MHSKNITNSNNAEKKSILKCCTIITLCIYLLSVLNLIIVGSLTNLHDFIHVIIYILIGTGFTITSFGEPPLNSVPSIWKTISQFYSKNVKGMKPMTNRRKKILIFKDFSIYFLIIVCFISIVLTEIFLLLQSWSKAFKNNDIKNLILLFSILFNALCGTILITIWGVITVKTDIWYITKLYKKDVKDNKK